MPKSAEELFESMACMPIAKSDKKGLKRIGKLLQKALKREAIRNEVKMGSR